LAAAAGGVSASGRLHTIGGVRQENRANGSSIGLIWQATAPTNQAIAAKYLWIEAEL
jgi:hypothetical protein